MMVMVVMMVEMVNHKVIFIFEETTGEDVIRLVSVSHKVSL